MASKVNLGEQFYAIVLPLFEDGNTQFQQEDIRNKLMENKELWLNVETEKKTGDYNARIRGILSNLKEKDALSVVNRSDGGSFYTKGPKYLEVLTEAEEYVLAELNPDIDNLVELRKNPDAPIMFSYENKDNFILTIDQLDSLLRKYYKDIYKI